MSLFFLFVLAADILQANDSLTQVINMYRQLVKGEDVSKDGITTHSEAGRLKMAVICVIWHLSLPEIR